MNWNLHFELYDFSLRCLSSCTQVMHSSLLFAMLQPTRASSVTGTGRSLIHVDGQESSVLKILKFWLCEFLHFISLYLTDGISQ